MISQLKYDPDVLTLDLGDEPMVPQQEQVQAYGTSEGVKKEWDTRGRGRNLEPRPLPYPPPPLPEGFDMPIPAFRTDDGTIYYDANDFGGGKTHYQIARELGVPPERIVGGGFLRGGDYNESSRSDSTRLGERARAMMRTGKYMTLDAAAVWYGIPIEGFNGPGEEMVRACISRIPRELLTNVECIKAAPELHPKHGRYDPTNKTVNINPLIFNLRQRFGNGQGWIYQSELCTIHEVGHSIYYFFPEKTKDEWRDISGWMVGSQDGQAAPYKETRPGWEPGTSKWTHKKGVKFTRKYATKNDDEDFADSFAFYILSKPHQMEPAKRDFIQNVIATRVKKYPQVLVEGPTKPYGERDLAAYGTSEGVTKAWDTRGRGRKAVIPSSLQDTLVGDELDPAHYHQNAVRIIQELDKIHANDPNWKENVANMQKTMANFPFIHTAKATIIPDISENGIEPAHKYNAGLAFDKIAGLDRTVFMRMGQAGGGGQGAVGVMIDPKQLNPNNLLITRLGLMTLKEQEDAFLRTPGDHSSFVAQQLKPYSDGTIPFSDLQDVQSRLLVNGYGVDHPDAVGKKINPSDVLENDHGEMEVKYADTIPSKAIIGYFAGDQPLANLGGKSAYDYLKGKVPDDKLIKYSGEGLHPLSVAYRSYYATKRIQAYGTSEGVRKEWDTRGRGRHENFKDFVSGVRFAKKEDFKELDRWFQESDPDVEADDRATNAADIAAEIALDKSSDTFIAEQNGQIIGALEVDPNFSPKQIEVKYLAVNPDIFRGNIQAKGTGTHLMVQAAKYAAYHNKGIFLSALPSARGFYKKLGMRNPNGGAYNWDADEAKAVASYGTGVSN